MKKVEMNFVCDDCGALLPDEYVRKKGDGDLYFDVVSYNTADFPVTVDCVIRVNVGLEVDIDYGGTYRELCPECRIKWLKKALDQFETMLKNSKKNGSYASATLGRDMDND